MKLYLMVGLWAIANLAGASPIVVDGTGRTVGFYSGAAEPPRESAVSTTGYRFSFNRRTGEILYPDGGPQYPPGQSEIWFASTDCTGQAYLSGTEGLTPGSVFPGIRPHPAPATPPAPPVFRPLYILPQSVPAPSSVLIRSYQIYTSPENQVFCAPDNTTRTVIPVESNLPSETGIPGPILQPPLRVISSLLFLDGFEAPIS